MPAIWATAISGIARKLSARPANVTREKNNAPAGSNAASVAADATNSDTIGNRRRGIAVGIDGATTRIASVAPKVRMNAGSTTENGWTATRRTATSARVLSGGLR